MLLSILIFVALFGCSENKKPTNAGAATLTRDVAVLNRYGIHARPAALLVKAASGFACEILLEKNGV